MKDNFVRGVFGLLIMRTLLSILIAGSPSALATLYNLENKFSQKFYIFSRTSGHLIVEPLHYDFGTVEKGQLVKGKFKLLNSGDVVLKFLKIAPGCGCTSAVVNKGVLNPGEVTELEFSVDTKDKHAYFKSGIEVQTTDLNNPVTILPITGWVGKGVEFFPPPGYLGVLRAGEKVTGKLQVLHGGVDDFRIEKVKSLKGLVEIGNIIKKDEHTYEIEASISQKILTRPGDYKDILLVYTTSKEAPLLKAEYKWTISPDNSNTK